MNRKIAATMLILVFATGGFLMAGSQPEGPDEGATDYLANMTAPGELPIVKEKVTLTVLSQVRANIIDVRTNHATKWLEEQSNIHLDWEIELTQSKEADQKLNLILASGDPLPDIMLNSRMKPDQVNLYGSQGRFRPLNDLIEKYGVEIKRTFDGLPHVKTQMTAPDGNIYGLWHVNVCHHCTYSTKVWINQKWLENLGLDTPETTEDFYQALKMFKTQDANGNGDPNDEIPFSGATTGWNATIDTFVMNAFIYSDNGDRLNMVSDKVVPAFTQNEWRDGLRFLNRLYKEGLLDRESFIQDQNQRKQLVMGGDHNRLGAAPGGAPQVFVSLKSERRKEFEALPPLRGPGGNNTAAYYPPGISVGNGARYVINAECEIPEIAFRFGDWLINDEPYFVSFFGEEDVNWRRSRPGEVGVDGNPAIFKEIDQPRNMPQQNQALNHMIPTYVYPEKFLGRVTDLSDPYYVEYWLERVTTKWYDGHQPKQVVPSVTVLPDDAAEYAELKVSVNEFMTESIARFVTGEASIETDWDGYLKELEQIGLARYVELTQKAYDRQYRGM